MFKNPRLKYSYSAEFFDEEKVLLASEKDSTLLFSRQHKLVLSKIRQKGVSVDELIKKLKGEISTFEIYYVLEDLKRKVK